jgi:hypothetical protein
VIDEVPARTGADDDARNAPPVAVGVDGPRRHLVVEATPLVPGQEDRGATPDPGLIYVSERTLVPAPYGAATGREGGDRPPATGL